MSSLVVINRAAAGAHSPFLWRSSGCVRQAALRGRGTRQGALGGVAAGAKQALRLPAIVAAAAAVAAAAVVEGGVDAGVLQAEQHAPPSRGVARVGDEVRVAGQPTAAAGVPALTDEQARSFHILPPIASQHGGHLLSSAHKKGAARPWNMSTDAPRPDRE